MSPAKTDEPLGLMYISSILKTHDFETLGLLFNKSREYESTLLSSLGEDDNYGRIAVVVQDFKPDVIFYSVITGEHNQCIAINSKLKTRFNFLSVFGGPHVTFFPEIIEQNPDIDLAGSGECEDAVVELIQYLSESKNIDSIQNFWVRRDDSVIKNNKRDLEPLDRLPFPDREIFKNYKSDSTYNLITERGCPYLCGYCFNDSFNAMYKGKGKLIRYRSPDNIISEMAEIYHKYPVKQFNFHDDIFTMHKKRTLDFCDAYANSGIEIPWSCSIKAEILSEEIVKAMGKANCNKIFMGVEAGNDEVRSALLRRFVEKTHMTDAVRWFKENGIQVFTQSILGFPTTSIEHDFETMEYNALLQPAFGWVSIFMPYPKTHLSRISLENNLINKDILDSLYDTYHYKTNLRHPHASQINALHKIFGIGVAFPILIPQIKKLVLTAKDSDIEYLHHQIYVPFRTWKYDSILQPGLEMPSDLKVFIEQLQSGRFSELKDLTFSNQNTRGKSVQPKVIIQDGQPGACSTL